MLQAQKAGACFGVGNGRMGAAHGILALFQGLSLATPLIGRSFMGRGPHVLNETRQFATVSRNFWQSISRHFWSSRAARQPATNLGFRWHLDHYIFPRHGGQGINAWWNLVALPARLNSFMNNQPATMMVRRIVTGTILASPVSGGLAGGWAGFTVAACGN